jgi:hypothetical protein
MKNEIKNKRTVGRLSVVFALCMILVMPTAVTAIGISLKLDNQMIYPLSRMSYSFDFKAPGVQAITMAGAAYATISLPGCLAIGKQAGDPMMPVKIVQLLLPPKKTVSSINIIGTPVTVKLSNINLKEKPILPQQPFVPIGSDQPPEFTMNSNVYSSNAVYPSATYSDYAVGYSHGYAILSFSLNPMQYNPVEGTLVYYPKMMVTITLQNDNANQFYSNNPRDKAYVETLVSNPEIANLYDAAGMPTFEYPGGLCDPSHHYDYVIITTTQNGLNYWNIAGSLHYNWNSLIAQHTGDGLTSTVVTVQDINACTDYQSSDPLFNDQPAHIREFCKDAYEDWGTRYVLIAGDSDTIAARQLYYAYEGNVDSDLYWSNLDNTFNADHDSQWGEAGDSGFDLYSEIFIGRVTCDSPQDVSNWLTKNIYYADSSDSNYLDKAAFFGGDTTWNCQGDDFMDYSAIKGTDDWLGPNPDVDGPLPTWAGFQFGFETWNENHEGNQFNLSAKWTEEPPNPGWQGGSESAAITGLRDAINNNDVAVISGIAHANNQMSLDVSVSSWENEQLYHNTMPFFVHDYGCHCGDFDQGDGVIESMLFNSDTYLAFGCVYNTGYGWGNFDSTNSSSAFQAKQFWNYFLNMDNYSGDYSNWQFGKGHAWSKDSMAPTIDWDASSGTWRGVIECCLLFGDPAQIFKTPHPSQSPTQPATPAGQTLVIWNQEYSYTSSATDPENEQIYYLFDWGDGSNSGWLGPYSSGQTVVGSHIWTALGTDDVKVKAKDIWGAASPWSEPLHITIVDNTPPAAPSITGPSQGSPGINYLFNLVTTDAQDQNVYYYVDWGDQTNSGWLGPYLPGVTEHVTHSWTTRGTFSVRVKAKDILNSESDWSTLDIVMPDDFNLQNQNQQLASRLVLSR